MWGGWRDVVRGCKFKVRKKKGGEMMWYVGGCDDKEGEVERLKGY